MSEFSNFRLHGEEQKGREGREGTPGSGRPVAAFSRYIYTSGCGARWAKALGIQCRGEGVQLVALHTRFLPQGGNRMKT